MLAYERFGSGEPMVLIHGIGHRRQTWYPVVRRLAAEYDVIIADLPGHGGSSALDRTMPAGEALRAAFAELFTGLGIERPHVVGNSLGGLIALELGENDLARSVTALSPAGFWVGARDFLYVRALFGSILTGARLMRPFAGPLTRSNLGRKAMLGWLYAHPQNVPAPMALGDLENMLRARATIRHLLAQAYTFAPGEPRGVPVTIAWAQRDRVLLPYQARRARRIMPHATHLWLDGCGHVPMPDEPELVAETIIAGARRAVPIDPRVIVDSTGSLA
ncbi:alpha/beta fold hydrolase [Nocardioides sp. BP30]|uniref:alpha/beta fold hydrolase n=1 Tax=Nocardioides sp. BP30 TaxID=3036374 RepID=UPI0024699ACF|nr:alpha/beta fold hydrolase [Nocardioides sp. BP30]WGL52843.1 alpha/beta fold hydrolase [Nocardioides sp. BP30]